jgi:beta-lactamase regulating signal transducer with metallopeptidase domain
MAGFTWMMNAASAGLALLGESSARAVVLLGAAWVACWMLRRRSAALRHLIWALSLAAVVAAPSLLDLAPKLRVPALWRPAAASFRAVEAPAVRRAAAPAAVPSRDSDTTAASLASRSEASWSSAKASRAGVPAPAAPRRVSLPALLAGLWAVGFCALLTRLGIGHWRVRKMASGAAVLDSSRLAPGLPAGRPVRFLQSNGEAMPMTWGWKNPVVLLPASFTRWDRERRDMTLSHELAHVRRADWLTQTLAQVAGAVYWFHPLVWLALDRLRIEADRACDDMVLRAGVKPSGYAGHLVQAAREFRSAGLRPWVAIAMAHPSSLNHRVQYVLDEKVVRNGLGRGRGLALALGMALLVLAIPSIEAVGQTEVAAPRPQADRNEAALNRARQNPEVAVARAWPDATEDGEPALASALALLAQAQGAEPKPQGAEPKPQTRAGQADAQRKMDEMRWHAAQDAKRAVEMSRFHWENSDEHKQPRLSPQAMQTAAAALRKALTSADANVRAEAAESLGRLGASEQPNLEALSKALSDSEPQVQKNAVESLGRLLRLNESLPADEAVRWLKPALSSPDAEIRREAAEALRRLRGQPAINAATQLVGDANAEVQREAIESLGRLLRSADAQTARAALPVLQKAMQHDNPEVRRELVETLGNLHLIADEVVPLLAKAAEDPDPAVQREAVEALGKISSSEAEVEIDVEDFVENNMDKAPWQQMEQIKGALADIRQQSSDSKK